MPDNWGEINVNRFFKALDTHPEIAVVLKEPEQTKAIGEVWHTDHSYDVVPAMGSILHAILQMLYVHCQKPEFQCRVRWQPGDVTMWDNRATWHKAINDYPGQRCYMHCITVEGCALEAA